MSARTFAELRAQIEAKMQAIAAHVGTTATTGAIDQVCFVITMLKLPHVVAQMRLGNTVEQTLERERYLAWVAEVFAEEVEQHDQISTAAVLEFANRSGPGGFTEDGVCQYLSLAERPFMRGDGN
jgi:hypothetical protein